MPSWEIAIWENALVKCPDTQLKCDFDRSTVIHYKKGNAPTYLPVCGKTWTKILVKFLFIYGVLCFSCLGGSS